jgi:hypothetical protein
MMEMLNKINLILECHKLKRIEILLCTYYMISSAIYLNNSPEVTGKSWSVMSTPDTEGQNILVKSLEKLCNCGGQYKRELILPCQRASFLVMR